MLEQRLRSTLAEWRRWPLSQQPKLVSQFEHGENHFTFLLQAGNQNYVLKLFRLPLSNRTVGAIRAQQWAARLQLAPNILFTSDSLEYALMEYCHDGYCDDIDALATALNSLHHATPDASLTDVGNFDLLAFYDRYLNTAGDRARALHEQLLPTIELYLKDPTKPCFCHNDLVKENCMASNGEAVFIDWEYAQRNNPWFDIASMLYYFNLDGAESRRFIQRYNPKLLDQLEKPIYVTAQCAFLWTDVLWHLAHGEADEWQRQLAKINDLRRLAI